ncbi:MAG: hypothetical protein WC276_02805 [Sedimentibacter sp.]
MPRSRTEISRLLGIEAEWWVKRGYIKPLIESGRLKMTIPSKPRSPDQKFVAAEYSTAIIASAEGLLEFCMTPRRKREIYLHFGLSAFQMKSIFNPLIENGRLICTDPSNPRNHWQKFVTARSDEATVSAESVERFCQEPRSREELAEFLGTTAKFIKGYIDVYLTKGIIKMTKPETPKSIEQRFISVKTNCTVPVLSAEDIQEFCRTPRSRQDIAERYGMAIYLARRHLDKMVTEGRLKLTMPDCPQAKQQRYVHPDSEINQFTEQALIEYCKTPRTRAEILKHFNFGTAMALAHHMGVFIRNGKIKHTRPMGSKKQMYVSI